MSTRTMTLVFYIQHYKMYKLISHKQLRFNRYSGRVVESATYHYESHGFESQYRQFISKSDSTSYLVLMRGNNLETRMSMDYLLRRD